MKKATTLFLAFLTIVGLQVSAAPMLLTLHYCGDELMELGVNDEVETCCPVDFDSHSEETRFSRGCCRVDIHSMDRVDQAAKVSTDISLDHECVLTAETILNTVHPFFIPQPVSNYANAPPHPNGKELCIRFERFLL